MNEGTRDDVKVLDAALAASMTAILKGMLFMTGGHTVTISDRFAKPAGVTAYDAKDVVGTNLTVTGATNAAPIEVTTSASHGLATGDAVTIAGCVGNTAANGNWIITKTADDKFTLVGSTGNGAWSAGGAVARCLRFKNIARVSGGGGLISKLRVVTDNSAHTSSLRIWLYASQPTVALDNAQHALLFANRAVRIGYIDTGAFNTEGTGSDSASAQVLSVNLPFVASGQDLFGVIESVAGFTPITNQQFYVELTAFVD